MVLHRTQPGIVVHSPWSVLVELPSWTHALCEDCPHTDSPIHGWYRVRVGGGSGMRIWDSWESSNYGGCIFLPEVCVLDLQAVAVLNFFPFCYWPGGLPGVIPDKQPDQNSVLSVL